MQGVSIQIIQVLVPITMFGLMFGMGLTLTPADFRRVLSVPKAVIVGLFLQLLALPAIGLGLAISFELSAMLALGLVAVAACPGGTMSNIVVHMGKGDTALSITLTATATLVTLFTLPLWINYSMSVLDGAETAVQMPILSTVLQLGSFTFLPVTLGMFVRSRWPVLISHEPKISKISAVAMIIAFLTAAVMDEDSTLSSATALFIPATLYLIIAVAAGYGIPRALGLDRKTSSTIAVETTLKNILLSMFIATNTLNAIDAAYASAVVGTLMLPLAIAIMTMNNFAENRETRLGCRDT
ncbi:hypothetical protein OAC48_06435 [Porticoccaceae bacterium]|nr:hypothetical protein [Porticoccaceae bacterium]